MLKPLLLIIYLFFVANIFSQNKVKKIIDFNSKVKIFDNGFDHIHIINVKLLNNNGDTILMSDTIFSLNSKKYHFTSFIKKNWLYIKKDYYYNEKIHKSKIDSILIYLPFKNKEDAWMKSYMSQYFSIINAKKLYNNNLNYNIIRFAYEAANCVYICNIVNKSETINYIDYFVIYDSLSTKNCVQYEKFRCNISLNDYNKLYNISNKIKLKDKEYVYGKTFLMEKLINNQYSYLFYDKIELNREVLTIRNKLKRIFIKEIKKETNHFF